MPESRRSARAQREAARHDDARSDDDLYTDRPRRSRKGLWITLGVLGGILLIGVGLGATAIVVGPRIADNAIEAADELEKAVPIASTLQQQIIDGDTEGAAASVDEMQVHTSAARALTEDGMWTTFEWVPWVGENLSAVRKAVAAADDLVVGVARPATTLSLDALRPVDGRIDMAQLAEVQAIVDDAYATVEQVGASLDTINRDAVIPQVRDGVRQLDDLMAKVEPYFEPLDRTLEVLPTALGADGPRNYLLLVQNNAESRGTGGNPAAILLLTVDDGKISIAQQAKTQDFNNNRDESILPLDDGLTALYGDKVGRYIQDITVTPSFAESAELVRAFWDESFDTPIDAVISTDPVALARLLKATGPVELPTGETLTSQNAVKVLLSDVYWNYEPEQTDEVFAVAASSVFDTLTSGSAEPRELLAAVVDIAEEGRLLYVPADEAEYEYLAGTRILGEFPADNAETTLLGAYIDDVTEGKLDYYLDTAVTVSTDMCTTESDPTFTISMTLDHTLDPSRVDALPRYVSPARFFPKGHISSDVSVYGPAGAELVDIQVDGSDKNAKTATHLGRPAALVNVRSTPGSTHTVTATFQGTADTDYGDLEAWYTPMVRNTPVTIDAPGCDTAGG